MKHYVYTIQYSDGTSEGFGTSLHDVVSNMMQSARINLGRTRQAKLRRDRYLVLKPEFDGGAESCAIRECDCGTLSAHGGSK